jgi:hypothetical protein
MLRLDGTRLDGVRAPILTATFPACQQASHRKASFAIAPALPDVED